MRKILTVTNSTHGQVMHINPDGLPKNPAFTNVIVVTGQVKTIYIGGQDAVDSSGTILEKGASKNRLNSLNQSAGSTESWWR